MSGLVIAIATAVVFGILVPIIVIVVNHEVRQRRIKLINEFRRNFSPTEEEVRRFSGRFVGFEIDKSPSFEFVVTKYAVDLYDDLTPGEIKILRSFDRDGTAIEEVLKKLGCFRLRVNRRLMFGAVPYMLITIAGFLLAFYPMADLLGLGGETMAWPPFLLAVGGSVAECAKTATACSAPACYQQLLTIMAVAFLGAWSFTLRIMLRAVSVFDLTPVTFIRAFGHVAVNVLVVVVAWRGLHFAQEFLSGTDRSCGSSSQMLWLIPAFLLGHVPEAGFSFMVAALSHNKPFRAISKLVKTTDDRFGEITKSISLDVIDGIDVGTRYRLEEAAIYEVQNLATANPIMLHVETPYGIYQTIDWVAQAQLCTVVGLERFLLLRQHNIRTVFDLERAVLDIKSSSQLRRLVGAILVSQTERERQILAEAKMRIRPIAGEGEAGEVNDADFTEVLLRRLSEPATIRVRAWDGDVPSDAAERAPRPVKIVTQVDPDGTIKQIVRTVLDDLHVQRLRQVWESIARKLGRDSLHLDINEDTLEPPPSAAP